LGIIVVRSSKIPARKNIGCLNGVHRAVIFAIALQLSCMRRCHVYCESEEVDCYLEWSGLAGWSVVSAWQLHLGASLLPGLPSVIIIITNSTAAAAWTRCSDGQCVMFSDSRRNSSTAGKKSVVSVVLCRFPNSITTTCLATSPPTGKLRGKVCNGFGA